MPVFNLCRSMIYHHTSRMVQLYHRHTRKYGTAFSDITYKGLDDNIKQHKHFFDIMQKS